MIEELMDMLKYKRPASSTMEELFIDEFIAPLEVMEDEEGNLFKTINNPDGSKPEVMFSSHTDTVHATEGFQTLRMKGQYITLHDKDSNCLGADCTSGVWLMMEMIRASKPGLYVFHRGEEIGGVGSNYIASTTPAVVDGIKCCIALDRMNTRDIITHQGMSRCCSDAFALSLARELGGKFAPSNKGVFTDSANYVDLIGECTNISVGYEKQHCPLELQDFTFLKSLRMKLLDLDYSKFEYSRDAGDTDASWEYGTSYGIKDVIDDDTMYDPNSAYLDYISEDAGTKRATVKESPPLLDMVLDYPDVVVRLLIDYGITESTLADEIYIKTGELV
jgi:hypothetical protein